MLDSRGADNDADGGGGSSGGGGGGSGGGPRCSDVADKLQQLFGWRQTYKVHKRHRGLSHRQQLTATISAPANSTGNDAWVVVHNLRSQAGGGILDPDDRLLDVADDREQIVANFEESGGGPGGGPPLLLPHGGGDGASAGGSSVGTSSPDIFQGDGRYAAIEVTAESAPAPPPSLQVRRGSEPALNQLVASAAPVGSAGAAQGDPLGGGGGGGVGVLLLASDGGSKRWSATPAVPTEPDGEARGDAGDKDAASRVPANGRLRAPPARKESVSARRALQLPGDWRDAEASASANRFARDGGSRLSMQFSSDARWADAADRVASRSLPRDARCRREPLGQATATPASASPPPPAPFLQRPRRPQRRGSTSDEDDDLAPEQVEYVVLHNEGGCPLGIHVVPDYDSRGRDRGLLVQGVEPGGRVARDGRLAPFDRIVEINGRNLLDLPFHRVQEIFKDSLQSPELRLRVVKHHRSAEAPKKPPAPVFPRSLTDALTERDSVAMVEGEERTSLGTKVATVSPTKKVSSPAVRPPAGSSLIAANTRKIGRKMELELTKGPHGLGFSITTRDNPAGGNCPIYIKNILPKGAAVEDGRLRPGDRLLEVNGVEMTGKTQAEAVAVLRDAAPGSKVRIVVSRQEDAAPSPALPRQIVEERSAAAVQGRTQTGSGRDNGECDLVVATATPAATQQPPEKANDDGLIFPWKHKEILTFDIPVHDTEKAGLGVSVKGKTTASHGNAHGQSGSTDLGIFVKSVLHGGAASRDGRLRTNDQLLNVNGISLLNQSNSDAMETLRRAMVHMEGPTPGIITLTVARCVTSHGPNSSQPSHSGRDSASSLLTSSSGTETFGGKNDVEGYNPDTSAVSENSENNTVIFLPYASKDESHDSVNRSNKSSAIGANGRRLGAIDGLSTRHPVIDRLTGQVTNPHALRNESYYRATNETWNTTMLLSGTTADKLVSPTVNPPAGEMVMIEEEYVPQHRTDAENHRLEKTSNGSHKSEETKDIERRPDSKGKQSAEHGSEVPGVNATYSSQLSLEEAAAGFSRDAFGRQSMSEKRHATLDAKHTDTYQRNKKLREERERQRQMQQQQQNMNDLKKTDRDLKHGAEAKQNREVNGPNLLRANSIESVISLTRSQADSERSDIQGRKEFGPSLGMKKSSSLESLQTMVQEIQMQEDCDPAYTYRNAQGVVRVVRGRGCNESFRAAVDRSYEAPLADVRARALDMETLEKHYAVEARLFQCLVAEEDVSAGQGLGDSECSVSRGGPRQSSMNAVLDGKMKISNSASGAGLKKKPGLLKGIGSMFRFGKHRKTLDAPIQLGREDNMSRVPEVAGGEREAARRAAQEEQRRIQEQYQRLVQRQRQLEVAQKQQQQLQQQNSQQQYQHQNNHQQQQQQQQQQPPSLHHNSETGVDGHQREGSSSSSSGPSTQSQSRTERIHQLRAQHQRKHAERRGQYPLDDREERYEEAIRQQHLDRPEASHGRSASYDLYGEMTRPGSRVGITDPAKFSHYVNYEEIQQHLNKRKEQLSEVQIMQMRLQVQHQRFKVEEESRRQQHYHSQRRDSRELHQRPASNFYEYESVQAVMRANQQLRGAGAPLVDANSNSLPRGRREGETQDGRVMVNGPAVGSNYHRMYQPAPAKSINVHRVATGAIHWGTQHSHDGMRNSGSGAPAARVQGPFVTQVTIGQQQQPPGYEV
ncbi:partitioning defective 3 homolog [Schistocerca americana]|uniref:partitioning defective 3 homolog n=1 Tax=Schistocerca americana TaxID=7009 RepID=UPI001F4F6884|nr:partitioning defective 3 homolog [Schistocerca americana]